MWYNDSAWLTVRSFCPPIDWFIDWLIVWSRWKARLFRFEERKSNLYDVPFVFYSKWDTDHWLLLGNSSTKQLSGRSTPERLLSVNWAHSWFLPDGHLATWRYLVTIWILNLWSSDDVFSLNLICICPYVVQEKFSSISAWHSKTSDTKSWSLSRWRRSASWIPCGIIWILVSSQPWYAEHFSSLFIFKKYVYGKNRKSVGKFIEDRFCRKMATCWTIAGSTWTLPIGGCTATKPDTIVGYRCGRKGRLLLFLEAKKSTTHPLSCDIGSVGCRAGWLSQSGTTDPRSLRSRGGREEAHDHRLAPFHRMPADIHAEMRWYFGSPQSGTHQVNPSASSWGFFLLDWLWRCPKTAVDSFVADWAHRLIDWSIDCLINWLIDWLIDVYYSIDPLIDWCKIRLIDWLID